MDPQDTEKQKNLKRTKKLLKSFIKSKNKSADTEDEIQKLWNNLKKKVTDERLADIGKLGSETKRQLQVAIEELKEDGGVSESLEFDYEQNPEDLD